MLANANNRRRGLAGAIAVLAAIGTIGCGADASPEPVSTATSEPPTEEALEGTTTDAGGAGQTTSSEHGDSPSEPISESDKEDVADQAAELPGVLETIELYFTSAEPDLVCGSLVTEAFIADAYGARRGCVLAQPSISPAEGVRVLGEINGAGEERLVVAVVPEGGPYAGQEVDVTLVLVDGSHRIDRLRSQVPVGP